MWAAAIATWCISSRLLGPPRIWQPRTAPRRCSHGYCGLWDAWRHAGPSWRSPFPRCCRCPYCRSAGYWQRCPSHRWSARRRLRFRVWSLTQTWGPWRICPDPRRSTPENNKSKIHIWIHPNVRFWWSQEHLRQSELWEHEVVLSLGPGTLRGFHGGPKKMQKHFYFSVSSVELKMCWSGDRRLSFSFTDANISLFDTIMKLILWSF